MIYEGSHDNNYIIRRVLATELQTIVKRRLCSRRKYRSRNIAKFIVIERTQI